MVVFEEAPLTVYGKTSKCSALVNSVTRSHHMKPVISKSEVLFYGTGYQSCFEEMSQGEFLISPVITGQQQFTITCVTSQGPLCHDNLIFT